MAFHDNMVKACDHLNKRFLLPDHATCKAAAYTYYESVKNFADDHFEVPSPAWCTESWVRGCML